MRLEEADFDGQPLEVIFVARKLRDALRLEEVLTAEQVDYLVRTGVYGRGLLFRSSRIGAFFWVRETLAGACRDLLARHGFRAEPG